MCIISYLAADRPLPTIPWNPGAPEFHVISPKEVVTIPNAPFAKRFRYWVGSHLGCACGFEFGEKILRDPEAARERERRIESVRRLHEYIVRALDACEVQLWLLDAGVPPPCWGILGVKPEILTGPCFPVLPGVALHFSNHPSRECCPLCEAYPDSITVETEDGFTISTSFVRPDDDPPLRL